MSALKNMPFAGFVVIVIIGVLFLLAIALLFYVFFRYRLLARKASGSEEDKWGFRSRLMAEYKEAYKRYGQDVNTPAIIADAVGTRLGGLLLCERFLNNAVSLFVTLGLFGTFLGLSMSVSSLTQLISYTNTEEWLSVLDSVGGGLMSALSGMGVAFYTSLVGAGCSILLTILRTIFNPQTEREKLETRLELWLDQELAPTLSTAAAKDDASLVRNMIDAMNAVAGQFKSTLAAAALAYTDAARSTAAAFAETAENNRQAMSSFDTAIERFNAGVHDFSEVDYNLRGSVERMDLAVRDLAGALREINRRMEGAKK